MALNEPFPAILKSKELSSFHRAIWRRIFFHDECFNCLVTGKIRKGKSILALKYVHDLDISPATGNHRFSLEKDWAFSPSEVLSLANRNDPYGKGLVWDEAGLGANSREWQKKGNIILSSLFQVLGFKHTINFITIPNKPDLDKQIRNLMHAHIHVRDHDGDYTYYTIKFLDVLDTGKELAYYPRRRVNGILERIKSFKTPKPPKELFNAYKKLEQERKKDIVAGLSEGLNRLIYVEKNLKKTATELNQTYKEVSKSPEKYENKKGLIDALKVHFAFPQVALTNCEKIAKSINAGKSKRREIGEEKFVMPVLEAKEE